MGAVEIREEIAKCEEAIKTQQQSFLVQRQEIIATVKPFVKARLKQEVENEVKRNAQHTKELGKTALSEMKAKLTELLDTSDKIVDDTFADDSLWIYVNYKVSPNGDRFGQAYNNKKAAEQKLLDGIKVIIGNAGKILIDYKYIRIGSQYRWDNDMRYDYTRAGKGAAKIVYGLGLALPEDIKKQIDSYCQSIDKLHELTVKVLDLQKALSEQEAVDLWNEA
mgnify:FL=1